jgi:cytochrome c oxidase subunit 3
MKQSTQNQPLGKIERLHPHFTLLYLGIVGSSLIFLFLGLSFVLSLVKSMGPVAFPRFFALSTIVLLFGSFVAQKLPTNFAKDQVGQLRANLQLLLLCSGLFLVSQLLGWYELTSSGVLFRNNTSGALLYILSGLHLLHLLAGVVYNAVLVVQAGAMQADPVKALVVLSSPYEHLKIKMLVTYWHFLDVVWLVLFLIFLFTI